MEPAPGDPAPAVQGPRRGRPHRRHHHLRRDPRARRGHRSARAPPRRGLPLHRLQARHRGPDPSGPGHRPRRARQPRHHPDRGRARRWPPLVGGPGHHAPGHLRRHPRRDQRGARRRRRHRYAHSRRRLPHRPLGRGLRHGCRTRRRCHDRHRRHDLPGGQDQRRRQAAPRRHPRNPRGLRGRGRLGRLRGVHRRHDLRTVPPARRPLRDRQLLGPGLPPHPGASR